MHSKIIRRVFLSRSVLAFGAATCSQLAFAKDPFEDERTARSRVRGMLIGSAIGDAIGGPIEFQKSDAASKLMSNCRDWASDRRIASEDLQQFASELRLLSYEKLRPKTEPYGQWRAAAPPGTVTDDTRHKMILINALREATTTEQLPISEHDLATAYLKFANSEPIVKRPEYKALCEESFREFWKSAHWLLGSRDLKIAAPPARIWGGEATCVGQMTLLPLAAIYPGNPLRAYRAAYALGFFDVGPAKDINSAIVAGLADALCQQTPTNPRERKAAWQAIAQTMRSTDPFRYTEVPYVTRPVERWLDFAHKVVDEAEGHPHRLFKKLEQQGEVRYYWESHFILALVFAAIEFCDYDPLAAMYLILNFGHDTDSGAQLLGAFAGALYGPELFPDHLQKPVVRQLAEDYDQSLDQWADLLVSLSNREKYPNVVTIE